MNDHHHQCMALITVSLKFNGRVKGGRGCAEEGKKEEKGKEETGSKKEKKKNLTFTRHTK